MGSAALGEAIGAIRDWSEKRGKETGALNGKGAFGSLVFNDAAQQKRLPKNVYEALRRTIIRGEPLDPSIADNVATALKDWAIENGATHYTHWFFSPSRASPRRSTTRSWLRLRTAGRCTNLREGARPGRARCVELPVRRNAVHVRGARLHRLGSQRARRGCSRAAMPRRL